MIRILWLVLFLLTGFSTVNSEEPEVVYAVGVDGLACPFCSYGIEKQLQKLDGVESVETDIKLGQVIIRMLDGMTLEREQVEKAIESAGFGLRSFAPTDTKAGP